MEVSLEKGSNQVNFVYIPRDDDNEQKETQFTDKFELRYITTNYFDEVANPEWLTGISLQYKPYQIYCHIWWDDENSADNLVLVMRIDNNRDYCFEIQRQNCRLVEISEPICNSLKDKWHID